MWHNDCETYVLLKLIKEWDVLNFVDLPATTKTTKINNPRKFLALRYE